MTVEIDSLKPFHFGQIIERAMSEQHRILQRDAFNLSLFVTTPIRFNKKRICQATGMSYSELNLFLEKHGFNVNGKSIEYDALEVLEKWYLKKLKRYLRNGLSTEDGTEEKVVFAIFLLL